MEKLSQEEAENIRKHILRTDHNADTPERRMDANRITAGPETQDFMIKFLKFYESGQTIENTAGMPEEEFKKSKKDLSEACETFFEESKKIAMTERFTLRKEQYIKYAQLDIWDKSYELETETAEIIQDELISGEDLAFKSFDVIEEFTNKIMTNPLAETILKNDSKNELKTDNRTLLGTSYTPQIHIRRSDPVVTDRDPYSPKELTHTAADSGCYALLTGFFRAAYEHSPADLKEELSRKPLTAPPPGNALQRMLAENRRIDKIEAEKQNSRGMEY